MPRYSLVAERLSTRHLILALLARICMYVCIYVYMYVYIYICLSRFWPPRAPTLRANIKATRLRLESSKVDLDRQLSVRGGGQSLTSLKVNLDIGLLVCIIHVVVGWNLTSLSLRGLLLDQQPQLFSCAHSVYCTHLCYRASHSQHNHV